MSPSLTSAPNTTSNANAELAAKIVAALREANFIAPTEEEAVMALLTSKSTKTGEWRSLLEKQLISSISSNDYATSH